MRVCVRLDDRVCSGWFSVEQVIRQGYVLEALLFNNFFAAVLNVVSAHFKADKGGMNTLEPLREKRRAGRRGGAGGSNCRRVSPGDAALWDASC